MELVSCPLYAQKIGAEKCREACSVIRTNEKTCSARRCPSPFRLCLKCLRQGRREPVVNAITGSCRDHQGELAETQGDSESGRVILVSTDRIRPLADQPRRYFGAEELELLERSILKRGQMQPGLVRILRGDKKHDYELIDGQRRWHACKKLGIQYRAVITDVVDAEDQFEMSIASNFQRADHTPMEIAFAIERLQKRGGRSMDDIATLFGRSVGWCYNYQRLALLDPALRDMVEPSAPEKDKLPLVLAFELALLPAVAQKLMLKKVRDMKLSAGAAVEMVRTNMEAGNSFGGPAVEVHNGRKRPPRDHFRNLSNFARRSSTQAALLQGRLSPQVVAGIRASRDVKQLAEHLETLSTHCAAIAGMLRNQPEKTSPAGEVRKLGAA